MQRTVTGTVAIRDNGLLDGEPAPLAGRPTAVATPHERLPFGRDEKQARTYDD